MQDNLYRCTAFNMIPLMHAGGGEVRSSCGSPVEFKGIDLGRFLEMFVASGLF